MKKELILFRCKHCGNLIMFVENSGVKIVCCGENMEELKVNTIDGIHEKHLLWLQKNCYLYSIL